MRKFTYPTCLLFLSMWEEQAFFSWLAEPVDLILDLPRQILRLVGQVFILLQADLIGTARNRRRGSRIWAARTEYRIVIGPSVLGRTLN
jgi:hypothetical protein